MSSSARCSSACWSCSAARPSPSRSPPGVPSRSCSSRSSRARSSRRPSTRSRCGRSSSRAARDVLGWVAGGLAAGLLVRELIGLVFTQQAYALPDPLGAPGVLALGGGITVPVRALEVLAIGLAAGVLVERDAGADRHGRRDPGRQRGSRGRGAPGRPDGAGDPGRVRAGGRARRAGRDPDRAGGAARGRRRRAARPEGHHRGAADPARVAAARARGRTGARRARGVRHRLGAARRELGRVLPLALLAVLAVRR